MNRSVNKPGSSNVICTPRTPRMQQRQRFDLSTRPEENEELDASGLHDLTGQTWNVYAVSALFGFQKDDVQLKLYSKRLREEIASNLTRENVTYDAKLSLETNCVYKPNHENHPAIKIEVLATTNDKNERYTEKSIYKGFILSWSVTQTEINIQNVIRLPLLLCCGTRSCMDAMHTILSHMFDCSIIALPATEEDLRWLVPIIIMSINRGEEPEVSGELQMEYTVPELPIASTITVKFDISDLRNMLSAIVKTQEDMVNISINREHVEMFHEILHTQMQELGSLQLGLCTLRRINLPGLSIMNNKMKVMSAETMDRILIYFNEKAYDTFHILHIDM